MVAMAATAEGTSRYQFKAAPYSSHTLLLAEFPEHGEGRRVLDVGCAIGYLSEILAQRGFAVTSIDWPNSPHPPTVEFAGADLDNGLPPLRGQFDYIICADVLEHLRAPLELLKECRARLAPGGMLVGSLPNSGHFYFRWNVLMGRFPQHQRGLFDSTHLHFYTWEGWPALLRRAGFRVEKRSLLGRAGEPGLSAMGGVASRAYAGMAVVPGGAFLENHVRVSIHRAHTGGDGMSPE